MAETFPKLDAIFSARPYGRAGGMGRSPRRVSLLGRREVSLRRVAEPKARHGFQGLCPWRGAGQRPACCEPITIHAHAPCVACPARHDERHAQPSSSLGEHESKESQSMRREEHGAVARIGEGSRGAPWGVRRAGWARGFQSEGAPMGRMGGWVGSTTLRNPFRTMAKPPGCTKDKSSQDSGTPVRSGVMLEQDRGAEVLLHLWGIPSGGYCPKFSPSETA